MGFGDIEHDRDTAWEWIGRSTDGKGHDLATLRLEITAVGRRADVSLTSDKDVRRHIAMLLDAALASLVNHTCVEPGDMGGLFFPPHKPGKPIPPDRM